MASASIARRHQTLTQVLFPQQTWIRHAALVILGSLFIAGAARVSIVTPITPVPITMQPFAVLLVGATFGAWLGMATAALYVAEGVLGLPFFAGGAHGWAVIVGSSGGYLVGYPFVALLVGWLVERGWDRTPLRAAAAMMLGNVVLYTFGLSFLYVWGVGHTSLLKVDSMTVGLTLRLGLLPFIPGDLAKLVLAAGLVPSVWQFLHALGFRGAEGATGAHAAPAGMRLAPLAVVAGLALAVAALMPWTQNAMGIEQSGGAVVLLAGLAGALAAFLRMRGTLSAGLLQLIGFAAGATGGLVGFVHLVTFTKAGTLALADISFGVPVAVIAALTLLGATASEAAAD